MRTPKINVFRCNNRLQLENWEEIAILHAITTDRLWYSVTLYKNNTHELPKGVTCYCVTPCISNTWGRTKQAVMAGVRSAIGFIKEMEYAG